MISCIENLYEIKFQNKKDVKDKSDLLCSLNPMTFRIFDEITFQT